MIKDKQHFLNRLHVVFDAVVVVLSYALAYLIKFRLFHDPQLTENPWSKTMIWFYGRELIFILPMYLLLYLIFRLYTPKRVMSRRKEAFQAMQANAIGALLIVLVMYLRWNVDFSRTFTLWFFITSQIGIVIERNAIRMILSQLRKRGFNQKHILIVGYSRVAEALIDRVKDNPQWGYKLHGILDDQLLPGEEYEGVPILGKLFELERILSSNEMDEVMITLRLTEYASLTRVVAVCEKSGVHTKFIPDYSNIIPTQPYTEDLLGLPVVNIRYVPLMNAANRFIKRSMDIIGSILCLILFSPVMIAAAIAVKATSKGHIIYKQERVGLHNRPFNMYKFRSMVEQDSKEEVSKWTTKNDSRVTKVGSIMRKTSIDELPQLFNVLKGDMSLVGPRPERPFFVEKFKEEIPKYMVKHQVRPGMTGWAQVHGLRGDTSIRERIEHDLYYIENWTPGLDIKILFMTVSTGFVNKNAY